MLRKTLIEHCAPTLAGIKTGNIFSIRNETKNIVEEIRTLNAILTKKGLRLVPVRRTKNHTMIYLYRPERLRRDLNDPKATEILSEKGYPCGNTACCLAQLARHLMTDESFPHEIGLFLGYPPSDVKRFMQNPSVGVKCSGCWKAYDHADDARKTFEAYKKCSAFYCRETKKGKPLEALIVDTRRSGDIRVAV